MTESLFSKLANCHENLLAIKVDGITKEEYAWGLRVGFITYGIKNGSKELYRALEDKTAGAIRGNISNSSHPAQSLFLNALKSPEHEKEKEKEKPVIKDTLLKEKAFNEVDEMLYPNLFISKTIHYSDLANGGVFTIYSISFHTSSTKAHQSLGESCSHK
jgi:aspartate/methionine/tyrosine aminotransferase